ncbi:MAG: DedA family protein [Nitriliruptorales bacterium]|nr:DedA family protein [Nitriliruptorales bacterium]
MPSEVVLPFAGFLAAQGRLPLIPVIVWATVGSVAGALVLYLAGARLGRARLRRLIGRLPLVAVDDLDRAEAWFDRHGGRAVFLGRLAPVVRSLISVPAGVERMPPPKFVAYTAAGSGLWNTLFVSLGYLLGDEWQRIGSYSTWINYAVIAGITVAMIVLAVRRRRR